MNTKGVLHAKHAVCKHFPHTKRRLQVMQTFRKFLKFGNVRIDLISQDKRQLSINIKGIFTPYRPEDRANCVIGNSVLREELFRYTNGRFLSDEDAQLSKFYVRFDIDKLCDMVAGISGTGTQHVSKTEKMEGGFSKALLMTMVDDSEYVVKIPCPNAGRPTYSTTSEVAVLNFGETVPSHNINGT